MVKNCFDKKKIKNREEGSTDLPAGISLLWWYVMNQKNINTGLVNYQCKSFEGGVDVEVKKIKNKRNYKWEEGAQELIKTQWEDYIFRLKN